MNPLLAALTPSLSTATAAGGKDMTSGLSSPVHRRSEVANATTPEDRRLEQAAREFEAVFLRQMLSSLERTTRVSSKGNAPSGQQAYGSMIVDAVADAVAKAGGLGVADLLATSLAERTHPPSPKEIPVISRTEPGTKPGTSPAEADLTQRQSFVSEAARISPQGLSRVAVPRSEIRASAAPIKGPLADRRIP